jgi:SAM-dependent methyltransferase
VRYIRGVNAAAGGWENWSWDESLFAGAAGYYEQGRLPYAPGLTDVFARSLALDGRGRLLDVGCGPGTLILRLAPLFEAAVGLDPDPKMLARASMAAARMDVGNASWVCLRAEDLPGGLGSFRAVTFAASFHWMDRPRVAAAVAAMLDPGGAVVQVDAPGYRANELEAEARPDALPFPPPPDDALDQLRRRYLGSDRRAGRGIRNTSPDGEDEVFQQAGFLPAETVTVPDQRIIVRTADDVVARVFSSSSTVPHLFGERRAGYEADMREIDVGLGIATPDDVPEPLALWAIAKAGGPSGHAAPGHRPGTARRGGSETQVPRRHAP